jgi:hypothetical protein
MHGARSNPRGSGRAESASNGHPREHVGSIFGLARETTEERESLGHAQTLRSSARMPVQLVAGVRTAG